MTATKMIPCQIRRCMWFRGIEGPPEEAIYVCVAFPKGIPEEVLAGKNLHTKPIPDDGGIQYEKNSMTGAAARTLDKEAMRRYG